MGRERRRLGVAEGMARVRAAFAWCWEPAHNRDRPVPTAPPPVAFEHAPQQRNQGTGPVPPSDSERAGAGLEVISPRCCGRDSHKRQIAPCRVVPGRDGQPHTAVRTFGTMTAALLAVADWLAAAGVTHVAMASTGVYWQPIDNILDDQCTLLLVTARHSKAVPGRKPDLRDGEWIADLRRHGLLRPSFVPDRPQRALRELTRSRTSLMQERSAAVNRLHKTLEGANIKLGSVAAAVLGVSSRGGRWSRG